MAKHTRGHLACSFSSVETARDLYIPANLINILPTNINFIIPILVVYTNLQKLWKISLDLAVVTTAHII